MYKKTKFYLLFFIFLTACAMAQGNQPQHAVATARKGNGVLDLLKKHYLSTSMQNIEYFQKINTGNFDKNGGLLLNEKYKLPVFVVKFDGKTIRSSINITNYALAKKIENYNIRVQNAKIKKGTYQVTEDLWVPYEIFIVDSSFIKGTKKAVSKTSNMIDYSYLLSDAKIPLVSNKMRGFACYIIAGHGGTDPGAIAQKDNAELHEHEYAYDVSIRLAKKLRENGADVYMIVQDEKDGIREEQILKNGGNEKLINGDPIAPAQIDRLKQRTDLVNDYYQKNLKMHKRQALIEIHLDSRLEHKQVDIFFYHRTGSKNCKKLNQTLLKTIEDKYNKAQPGRGYKGTVTERDLFTLRNTQCDAAFIELGNIQNAKDRQRFLEPNNRQAIANWLYDGILKHYFKK